MGPSPKGIATAAREGKTDKLLQGAISRTCPCQQTNGMRVTFFRAGTQISGTHLQLLARSRCCALARTGDLVLFHRGELCYKMGRLRHSN